MTGQRPPLSFKQLEGHQKDFSDAFVIGAVEQDLRLGPGENDHASMVKSYLDQIPADATDEAFIANKSAVERHRAELSGFIGHNLRVVVRGLPDTARGQIREAKARYLEGLEAGKPAVNAWMHGWRTGQRPKMPQSEVGFYGFNVTLGGNNLELTEANNNYTNLASSIIVQRQLAGQFVQWRSKGYLADRALEKSEPVTRRIYLNPRIADSVSVFQQVVSAAEASNLSVTGKILDRSTEAITPHEAGTTRTLRGDGIVLYAPEKDADALLQIAEAVYTANPEAFKGRRTSRVPMKVADGFAVGSEVTTKGESLTSNRAEAIERAVAETRDRLGMKFGDKLGSLTAQQRQRVISVFRRSWDDIATAAGIDPRNVAFNKK